VKALKDPDSGVRRNAAEALGRVGPEARPAVPLLVQALKDEDSDVQDAAAEALKRIDPAAAKNAGIP
jgi:HEAT repeat protein